MSIEISPQGRLAPDAQIVLGPDNVTSAKQLNKEMWRPDRHDLADALLRALRQLVGDEPRTTRQATLVQEYDVTALSAEVGTETYSSYAQLAANAVDTSLERYRLLQLTRSLGGSTDYGPSSLDDVRDGPVALLDAADADATLDIRLESFFDLKSNQRAALLRQLSRLTPGVDVRITGLQPALLNLVDQHGDLLPASVTESAESGLHGPECVSTRSERRRQGAREALATKGTDHDDWSRLYALYQEANQQATYDELEANTLVNVRTREALRKWAGRMADLGMIERTGPTTARRVRLLPKAVALLDEHPSLDVDLSRGGAGRTDVSSQPGDGSQRSQQSTVSDPPKTTDSSVYTPTAEEGGGDRPTDEAATATAGGADAASRDGLDVGYLDGWEHDAAVSAAEAGDIALVDRPVDSTGDSRGVEWSFLEDRDEAVVRIEASASVALTMVRLCSALLSEPAFQQVLTVNRLAGGKDRAGLDGLPVSQPFLLRDGGCLGYLNNADADAKSYRKRLRKARDELTQQAAEIAPVQSATDAELGQLHCDALGLAGTVTRLYDMLGVDLTRVVDVPDWALDDEASREHFAQMLAKQTAVSSRYGLYSANRVLFEPREEKREQLLGTPDIKAGQPSGDVVGNWVLVGSEVDSLRADLKDMTDSPALVLQEDEQHYAPFTLPVDVVDGNQRSVFATALARRSRLRNIDTTRQTVGTLQALSSDVFAASKAVHRLGSEDDSREMDLVDVRSGLSHLDALELLPDIGGRTVGKVVKTLLDADETITTSTLADLAGVSAQTLRNNEQYWADLEAAGLLERVEGGPGKATEWRLTLPFADERRSSEAPNPTPDADNMDSTALSERPIAGIAEALFAADHRDIDYGAEWFLEATTPGGDLGELVRRRVDLVALVELVIHLFGWDPAELPIRGVVRDGDAGLVEDDVQITMGADPSPSTEQQSITAAAD